MKSIIPCILILLLAFALAWMWFDKPSGHDQERQRLLIENQNIRIERDAFKAKSEEWRLKALEYGNQFRNEATRAMKSEQNLNYALEENRILKRRVIRYSNKQLDSVFTSRYPH